MDPQEINLEEIKLKYQKKSKIEPGRPELGRAQPRPSSTNLGVTQHDDGLAELCACSIEALGIQLTSFVAVQDSCNCPPPCQLDHLLEYKKVVTLPPNDAKAVKRRAPTYVLIGDTLYKRSYNGALLRCLYPNEARSVIEEIHEGTCLAHQGAYTMA